MSFFFISLNSRARNKQIKCKSKKKQRRRWERAEWCGNWLWGTFFKGGFISVKQCFNISWLYMKWFRRSSWNQLYNAKSSIIQSSSERLSDVHITGAVIRSKDPLYWFLPPQPEFTNICCCIYISKDSPIKILSKANTLLINAVFSCLNTYNSWQ